MTTGGTPDIFTSASARDWTGLMLAVYFDALTAYVERHGWRGYLLERWRREKKAA